MERPVFKIGIPPHNTTKFEVLLKNGSRRTVSRISELDFATLFFTDCTHPEQNAYCSNDSIKAYRVV